MAQIHVKALDPSLFTKTGALQQASCTVQIDNTGNVHNLVEGDTWHVTCNTLGNVVSGWAAFSPSTVFEFYFGTGAMPDPTPGVTIQARILIDANGADNVASQISTAINAISQSLIQAIWTSGASFILVAKEGYVGTLGNSLVADTVVGKITNENGSNFVGGQDSTWTLENYFSSDTFGIPLSAQVLGTNEIAPNSTDLTGTWGLLPTDLQFTTQDAALTNWAAGGWSIAGGSYFNGDIRPDFDVNLDVPNFPSISLGGIKGFLIQCLGQLGNVYNPSNLDINLHFTVLAETDTNSIVTAYYMYAVAYLGNQDAPMDSSPSTSSYGISTTPYGPNEGASLAATPQLCELFDTVPVNGGATQLPILASQPLGLSSNPPAQGDDIGIGYWGPAYGLNYLTRTSTPGSGDGGTLDGMKLIYAGNGPGMPSFVTNGDWFVVPTGLFTDPSQGVAINMTFTLLGAPSANQTLFDYGYNGTGDGVRIWLDPSQIVHFGWGVDEIDTGISLAIGSTFCCTFMRIETNLLMEIHPIFIAGSSDGDGQYSGDNVSGYNSVDPGVQPTLLANNDGSELADNVGMHGLTIYPTSSVSPTTGGPSQFSLSSSVSGHYPVGTYLPTALHHFWVNYQQAQYGDAYVYQGAVAPAPIIFFPA